MHQFALRGLVLSCLFGSLTVYAAKPVDLSKSPTSLLNAYLPSANSNLMNVTQHDQIKELNRNVDARKNTHIRVQQFHQGYPVWGADAVVHIPSGQQGVRSLQGFAASTQPHKRMNGIIYQGLDADLQNASQRIFTSEQAEQASATAAALSKSANEYGEVKTVKQQLMVYVDNANKAHWVFFITNRRETGKNHIPAITSYILDADTLSVYESWNEFQSADEAIRGGGLGGNMKSNGALIYDGLPKHLSVLSMKRAGLSRCLLANDLVEIYHAGDADNIMSFNCDKPNAEHNNVFWNGSLDQVNGGYSPANDALYAGSVVQALFNQWLGVPMLKTPDGKPMLLKMYVHQLDDDGTMLANAGWDPQQQVIYLGDGDNSIYPLTSLGIISHEVSHGFTQQHAGLIYKRQSGGMNESFSDMAAKAAENFMAGQNTWELGSEVFKAEGVSLRYMDQPSKDCPKWAKPGDRCSIDEVSQYRDAINVHYTSGIYNRVFYLLSTSDGWNVRKAFTLMAQANANYWTATSTFVQGACGVMSAASDLAYESIAIQQAFATVGIDVGQC